MMKWSAFLGLVLAAPLLTACVSSGDEVPGTGPQITLQEARQFQNRVLLDLGEHVPTEHLRGKRGGPIERMRAMKCDWAQLPASSSKDSGVFLPGGYNVEVLPETDSEIILELISEGYENQGWAVISEGSGVDRELELISPEGYTFYIRFYNSDVHDREFVLSSFSPCIEAPDDFDIFVQY